MLKVWKDCHNSKDWCLFILPNTVKFHTEFNLLMKLINFDNRDGNYQFQLYDITKKKLKENMPKKITNDVFGIENYFLRNMTLYYLFYNNK